MKRYKLAFFDFYFAGSLRLHVFLLYFCMFMENPTNKNLYIIKNSRRPRQRKYGAHISTGTSGAKRVNVI